MSGKKRLREPPEALSAEAKGHWLILSVELDLEDKYFTLMKTLFEAYDGMSQALDVIREEGMIYKTQGGLMHENPACKLWKECRSGYLQSWRALGVKIEPPAEPGRPTDKRELEWERMIKQKQTEL